MTFILGLRKNKFNAVPTTVDNIRFASKKEAKRYSELKLMEKSGYISQLKVQPRYTLVTLNQETQTFEKVGVYVADFEYRDVKEQRIVTEDCKSAITLNTKYPAGGLARWKMRHFEIQFGRKVRIV